ncbi:MAG: GNAT family N-acetyltransferase [Rhodocyclaceae bacterium]|nr:GNAT family N-acetyltransferase [Rhodocyclaceae bacterium]
MILTTEDARLSLRPWRIDDVASIVRHGNDRAVWANLTDAFPHPYTPADAAAWVAFARAPGDSLLFAVDWAGEAIGGAGVMGEGATGQFGYWLGQAYWGRGIGTKVAWALKAAALASGRFRRLEAPVFAWNTASIRVLEKVGFTRVAGAPRSVTKAGRLCDVVTYAAGF